MRAGAALCAAALLATTACGSTPDSFGARPAVTEVKVLTFNVEVGGFADGLSLEPTIEVVRRADAGLVGLQEHGISGFAIAERLGYELVSFDLDRAVLSRFPVLAEHDGGVTVELPSGERVFLFVAHLAPEPYEPYLVRDGVLTSSGAVVESAQRTRGDEIAAILSEVAAVAAEVPHGFLVGDFNEPSHLDWTVEAADAGRHFGLAVGWPTSVAIAGAGFADAYRAVHPDPVSEPGDTWTPQPGPAEVHDRIDLVHYRSGGDADDAAGAVTEARVVGEPGDLADVEVDPWPSDHRAVLATVEIPVPPGGPPIRP